MHRSNLKAGRENSPPLLPSPTLWDTSVSVCQGVRKKSKITPHNTAHIHEEGEDGRRREEQRKSQKRMRFY